MILYVEHDHLKQYPGLKSALYRLRTAGIPDAPESELDVFADQDTGLVLDILDDISPSYLLCLAKETGAVMGAVRLLQTMGPHMLSDLVPEVVNGDFPLRSPCLWEMSRFCVESDEKKLCPGYTREAIAAKLIIGAMDLASRSGVTDYILVMGEQEEELLSRIDTRVDFEIGRKRVEKWGVGVAAAILSCSNECASSLREKFDIDSDIWVDDDVLQDNSSICPEGTVSDQARMLMDALKGKMPPGIRRRLQLYCAQQLLDAKTEKERRDAFRLMRYLRRMMDEDSDGSLN